MSGGRKPFRPSTTSAGSRIPPLHSEGSSAKRIVANPPNKHISSRIPKATEPIKSKTPRRINSEKERLATEKLAPQLSTKLTNPRPKTAKPKRGEIPPEPIDIWAEAEKLQKEIMEEFPDEQSLSDSDPEYLNELTRLQQELSDNVNEGKMINPSLANSIYQAGDMIEETIKDDDDIVNAVNKMLDDGFDSFHAELEKESAIIQRRNEILQKFKEELTQHSALTDFTADTLPDTPDDGLDIYIDPIPSAPVTRAKTAVTGTRRRIQK